MTPLTRKHGVTRGNGTAERMLCLADGESAPPQDRLTFNKIKSPPSLDEDGCSPRSKQIKRLGGRV
jgi:hypothetical protein